METFGTTRNVQFVIIVQVHNRSLYLDMLVSSLETARDIEKALVIFSHDFISEKIIKIVRNIKFCRVMQIFYPHSIQMYGNKFPGQDPNDCPPKITRQNAKSMNCNNWEHPDKYGHYRVAKFTQIKHHWWWKLNYVVNSMECLKGYSGYFLLLEEDHFVSPDFLGIHHNKFATGNSAREVKKILGSIKDQLFPQTLNVTERSRRNLKAPKEYGGWADPRDHKLCQQHATDVIETSMQLQ